MPQFPHLPSVLAQGNSALHSNNHVPTNNSIRLLPIARLSSGIAQPPHLLLALTPTTKPLSGCHALALTAPATMPAVVLLVLTPPALPTPDNEQYAPAACFPTPHMLPAPPSHTHGSSLASANTALLPPAPFVAANSYQSVKPAHPTQLSASHLAHYRDPPPLPMCNHPQKQQAV